MAAVLFCQRNKRFHQHRSVYGTVHHGLITQGGLPHMRYLDVVAGHEAFQELQRQVVRAGMKIDRDSFLSQGLRMGDRRIWTDEDRLTCDGSAEIDDTPADSGIVRASDLAPFAGVEGC